MATIRIPTPLRKLTQGKEEVTASGATIGALIASLETQYPGIKERICDDSGQVRRFVNIFANDEDIRFLKNLDTPVKDSDEISIVPAIAGGDRVVTHRALAVGRRSLRAPHRAARDRPRGTGAHRRGARRRDRRRRPGRDRGDLPARGGRRPRLQPNEFVSEAPVAEAFKNVAEGFDLIIRSGFDDTPMDARHRASRVAGHLRACDGDRGRHGRRSRGGFRRPTRAPSIPFTARPRRPPMAPPRCWPGRWPRPRRCT